MGNKTDKHIGVYGNGSGDGYGSGYGYGDGSGNGYGDGYGSVNNHTGSRRRP